MPYGLNPFEVREVLQGIHAADSLGARCLNPFEVREVLQGLEAEIETVIQVSIPLKSGRCCKALTCYRNIITSLNPFEVREVLQVAKPSKPPLWKVSIPLKSGRCCKGALQNFLIKINKLFVNFR